MKHVESPPQFLWLFQACECHCRDYYDLFVSPSALESLYTSGWDNISSPCYQVITRPQIYIELCKYIFSVQNINQIIEFLQKQGYFLRGNRYLFQTPSSSAYNYLSLIECIMWAYIDKKMPIRDMQRVIGRTKQIPDDPEALLCLWINTIVVKHVHLSNLNVIGQQFFALPHFKIILYNYTHDKILLNTNETPKNNMEKTFECLRIMKIPLPFDENQINQPVLCILCFLVNAIVALSQLPRNSHKEKIIYSSLFAQRISGIKHMREEVKEIENRVHSLNDEVSLISKQIQSKSRPASQILRKRAPKLIPQNLTEQNLKRTQKVGERIKWDPQVIEAARLAKQRQPKLHKPSDYM